MNKWVAITGSSNGIGAGLAEVFAQNGYSIILHGRNQDDLERMYKKIKDQGVEADIVEGDVRNSKTLEALLQISQDRDIDVLVNNVGYRCPGLPLNEINNEQIKDMLDVSLNVPIKIAKEAYKYFIEKKEGCIMNMISIVGLEPKKLRSVYTAVRHGLRGFTESLRLEAADNNIRVIGIYPTRVMTKPEFEYGWNVTEACEKIFHAYKDGVDNLILDDRPAKYRPSSYPINARVHLLNP